MAVGVFVVGLSGAWVGHLEAMEGGGSGPYDLRPYLDGPSHVGLAGFEHTPGALQELLLGGPGLATALMAGCVAVLLFLALESFLRITWSCPNEVAALTPAVLFAVLPAQLAFQLIAGGATLLLALGLLLLACLLALSVNVLSRLLGAAAGAMAAAAHPALILLLPAVLPCLWLGAANSRSRQSTQADSRAAFRFTVVVGGAMILLAIGDGLVVSGSLTAPPIHGSVGPHRSRWALELLASSPILAFFNQPRDLLPTGFEAVTGGFWPIMAGLSVWGLLLAFAMLTAGIARGVFLAGLAGLAGAAPFVLPGWVPGDRAAACLPLLPAVTLLALGLSVVRGRSVRVAGVVVAVVIGAVCLRGTAEAHAGVQSRRSLFMVDSERLGFVPDLEPDPARLVLYGYDLWQQEQALHEARKSRGRFPSFRERVVSVARGRLQTPAPPALAPEALLRIATRLTFPIVAAELPDELRLLETLGELELAVAELSRRQDPENWYAFSQARLSELTPQALEILYALRENRVRHPRFHKFNYTFTQLVGRAAVWATELGDLQYSVPLRELLVEMTEGYPRNQGRVRGILGLELLEMKRWEDARTCLTAAAEVCERSEPLGAVVRGALASLKIREGQEREALEGLNRAWDGLAGQAGRWRIASPGSRDYWLIAEMLLLRYELARRIDPALAEQAGRDLRLMLEPALASGPRRVPALAFWGRLKQLDGDVVAARIVLLEMRALSPNSFGERGSGASGLLDTPRFRLVGLRALLGILDPASDQGLKSQVEAEIRQLDRY